MNPHEVPGVDLPEVTRVGPVVAVEPLVVVHQRTTLGGACRVGVAVAAVVLVHSREPPLHRLGDAVAATKRTDDATLATRVLLLAPPNPSCDGPLPRAGRPLQRIADVVKARPHVVRVDGGTLSAETEVLAVTRCARPVHQPLRLVGRVVEEVHPYEVGDGACNRLVVVRPDVLGKWHDQPVTRRVRLVAVRSVQHPCRALQGGAHDIHRGGVGIVDVQGDEGPAHYRGGLAMRAVKPTTDEAPDVLDAGPLVTTHGLVLLGRLRCADGLLEPCDQIRPHDPRSSPVCVSTMLADTDFVLALVHNFSSLYLET